MDLAKWLGTMGEGSALFATISTLASLLGAVIYSMVRGYRKQRERDMERADRPTVVAPATPHQNAAELAVLRERLREVERDQDIARLRLKYEDSLEDRQELRIEVERLQNGLTTERAENALLRARVEQLEAERAQAAVIMLPDDDARTWLTPARDVFATPPRPPKLPREKP